MDSITTTAGSHDPDLGMPVELAAQINAEHDACTVAVGEALGHALNAGDLLAEAKRLCPHGTWQNWLAQNFRGSARSARAYMRLACHRQEIESKMAGSAVLSIDGALRLLSTTAAPFPIFDEHLPASEVEREQQSAVRRFYAWRRRADAILDDPAATLPAVLALQKEANEVCAGWAEYKIRCERHLGKLLRGFDAATASSVASADSTKGGDSFLPEEIDCEHAYVWHGDRLGVIEIFPSRKNPGYAHLSIAEFLDGEGGVIEQTKRPFAIWAFTDPDWRRAIVSCIPHSMRYASGQSEWLTFPAAEYEPLFVSADCGSLDGAIIENMGGAA